MIIIGIYITRDAIYGVKSDLGTDKKNVLNLEIGVGLIEEIFDGAKAHVTVKISELHGAAILKVAHELMEDGIAPDAISIACYGPFSSLSPIRRKNRKSDTSLTTYGEIAIDAHFAPFRGFNLAKLFGQAFRKSGVNASVAEQIIIQTDVAAAGLAEWAMRHNEIAVCHDAKIKIGREHLVFLSFRGGVGGAVIDRYGQIVNGFLHPEMGQISVEIHPSDLREKFNSVCPHHDNCLEGFASDEAFFSRFENAPGFFDEIIDDTGGKAWEIHAYYVAQLCAAATLMFSPTAIVLYGDVFSEPDFLTLVRDLFVKRLGGEGNKAFAWYPLLEREDGFLQTAKLAEPGLPGSICVPVMQVDVGPSSLGTGHG